MQEISIEMREKGINNKGSIDREKLRKKFRFRNMSIFDFQTIVCINKMNNY